MLRFLFCEQDLHNPDLLPIVISLLQFLQKYFNKPPTILVIGNDEWARLKDLSSKVDTVIAGNGIGKSHLFGLEIERVDKKSHLEVK